MENITYNVIALAVIVFVVALVGLVIIIAVIRSRRPITPEKARSRQKEVFDNYLKMDPGLRDIFKEALQAGATHMKHAPQLDSTDTFSPEETIAFYRTHDGNYEKRYFFLHERTFTKGAKWGLNWLKCEEILQDAIPIPPIDYQHEEIDGMLVMYPDLKDYFVEANGDGATHVAYFRNQDVIIFYRSGKGKLEFRNLVFIPDSKCYWGSDWQKCNEIPSDAIQISDMFKHFY